MPISELTRHRLIDLYEVVRRTGLSRSTIYNYISAGLFPRPRKLGLRRVAWLESDVNAWIAERPPAWRPESRCVSVQKR
jgi:prophage regulatory protein